MLDQARRPSVALVRPRPAPSPAAPRATAARPTGDHRLATVLAARAPSPAGQKGACGCGGSCGDCAETAASASGPEPGAPRTQDEGDQAGAAADASPGEVVPELVVAQAGAGAGAGAPPAVGTTPDGTTLGPTDPSHHVCLASNRLIWVGGPNQNTSTAATGRSRVTASLGTEEGCDCGCGLFRQFIRGFWRTGSPAAAKRHDVTSCGNPLVMSETAWTEEFEACNPGGSPQSADCARVYTDEPGFGAGLVEGTFVEVHLDLRYQMWDQCRGVPVATGDRSLRISGDRAPRAITFS